MKFRFHIEPCAGPWLSLGFHVDFKHLYVDLHLFWWIVSFGNLYMLDMALAHRERPEKYRALEEASAVVDCPKCGTEFEVGFDLAELVSRF